MNSLVVQHDFTSLGSEWERLVGYRQQASIFLTPQWQRAWWDEFGRDMEALRLFRVESRGEFLGVAPMFYQDGTLSFLGDTDLFDYHDFVLPDRNPIQFYQVFGEFLSSEEWDKIDLKSVPASSPTVSYLPEVFRGLGYQVALEDEDVVPGMVLPTDWDEYLAGLRKKDRHELRRKLRRLEGAGEVRIVSYDSESLDADIDLFLELMMESREEKRDFMMPERESFFRRVVRIADANDNLRLFFLSLNGERVAATLFFDYEGRRLMYNSGYRLAHRDLAVGLMLKALCVRDAIENRLTYFDFLRGSEPYKRHLGGEEMSLHRIVVTR